MSRPYQFTHDHSQRSPLDRQPQPSGSQPASFSTNVNRAKTKKWVEAKTFSYDGDDWGDYDEIDEYGASAEPPMPAQNPAQNPAVSNLNNAGPARSFTDPRSGGPQALARKNSFDAGDERRAFSGPQAPQPRIDTRGPQPPYNVHNDSDLTQSPSTFAPAGQQYLPRANQQQSGSSHVEPSSRQSSAASWGQSVISETPSTHVSPEERRDFTPSAMPQPLSTRASPAPAERSTGSFPPRKSSLSQDDAPFSSSVQQNQAPGGNSSSPVFVRPADIYKRLEEAREKERGSMDSNRPSLDTSQAPNTQGQGTLPTPKLPQISTSSTFGDDFLFQSSYGNDEAPKPEANRAQLSPAQAESAAGYRGMVDQAFTRRDDNSVPPTPVSRQKGSQSEDGSGVSRSNTDSTSGISPIMSRVPSSAAAAARAKVAEDKDMATPVIVEESPNASRRTSTTLQGLQRKAAPPHSRNASVDSTQQWIGLGSPSPTQSPARSPIVTNTHVPATSAVGEVDAASPPSSAITNAPSPPNDYTIREADIAAAASNSPEKGLATLARMEKDSQTTFLEQKREFGTGTPGRSSTPASRSGSPSKGRVHDLAGRFGDVADSRRNSAYSIKSRNSNPSPERPGSVESWERPFPTREESFRPKLPGQWESYATTPGLEAPGDPEKTLQHPTATPTTTATAPVKDEEIDLEPTTVKRSATLTGFAKNDPLAALAAAGSAMGESIKAAAAGMTSSTPDPYQTPNKSRSVGNVHSRPVGPDRLDSSVTVSTAAPSPPPKDDSEWLGNRASDIPPVAPLKDRSREGTPARETVLAIQPTNLPNLQRLSTDDSPADEESDRLRREIVQSLSPITAEKPEAAAITKELSPPTTSTQRESSVLPAEYDSFWAGAGTTDGGMYPGRDMNSNPSSPETIRSVPAVTAELPAASSATKPAELPAEMPAYDRQFSWEKPTEKFMVQNDPQPAAWPTGPAVSSATQPPTEKSEHDRVGSVDSIDPQGPAVNRGFHVANAEALRPSDSPVSTMHDGNKSSMHDDNKFLPSVSEPTPDVTPEQATPPAVDTTRIPPFREILALKSSQERISSYNKTREQFAAMDTGLRNWLSVVIAQRPEHADVRDIASRPPPANTPIPPSSRHKHAPSLSIFSKINLPSTNETPKPPAYSQPQSSNSPSSPVVHHGAALGSGSERTPTSGPGGKKPAKGKDLLHSAGLLGGKATTGAKGLFAKGKSRFKGGGGGDKAE